MARPRRALRDQLVAETRERLLAAATAEFARQGYTGANINRISQAAGYAKGTVYNHFPSKRALMLALIDRVAAAHTAAILPEIEREPAPTARLERFFRAGFAFVEGHPEQAQLVIGALYGPDPEFRARVYQAYQPLFAAIAERILTPGVARGDFRSLDPDLVTALLMTIYLGGASQVEPDGRVWLDPARVAAFALDGLRPR